MFEQKGAREREMAAMYIERAEAQEKLAALFGDERAAALKGEKTMDRNTVLRVMAIQLRGPEPKGPVLMANDEPGVRRTPKRPHRNDRRRRRGGFRFKPKPAEAGEIAPSPHHPPIEAGHDQ